MRLRPNLHISNLEDDFVVAIDASGIKVTNRGDWIREKHGKKRKGWIKLHIAVDTKSKRLVGLKVTDERTGDNSRENFNQLSKLGIIPGIKPRAVETIPKGWMKLKERRRLRIRARGCMPRKENVIEYTTAPGRWKKRIGYGKRWAAEIFFSVFKRIFGEHVRARRFENMVNELVMKAMLYNMFVSL